MTNLYTISNLIYKDYLQMLKDHDNPMVWFELTSSKYRTNTTIILKVLKHYIENELEKPEFVTIFEKIDELENPYEYLYFNNITPAYLKEHLEEYLIYYRPEYKLRSDNKLMNNYRGIIAKYAKYYQSQTNIKMETEYKKIILEFINSNYSLERFCIFKGLSLNDFNYKRNGIYIKAMKNDPELYSRYLSYLEEKNKKEIIQGEVKKVLEAIYTLGNDFSIIDLFLITNYGVLELIKESDNILANDDLKIFRKYMDSCYREYTLYGNFTDNNKINMLITTPYSIFIDNNLVETSEEDRYQAINFLITNKIPINQKTFETVLKRFYKDKKIRKKDKYE